MSSLIRPLLIRRLGRKKKLGKERERERERETSTFTLKRKIRDRKENSSFSGRGVDIEGPKPNRSVWL